MPKGIGFGLFTSKHFLALALCAAGILCLLRGFARRTIEEQRHWLRVTAVLMLLGNLARDLFLFLKGKMSVGYLPFHLCSFAIFVYLLYAFLPERSSAAGSKRAIRDSRFRAALGEIGCVLLLPGCVAALIFPDWSSYPLLNFMCIHGFLWHAVLTAFPLMLLVSHRVRLSIRHIWYPIVYLAVLVPPTLFFDRHFSVNYLFINWPLPGTPLMVIYKIWGKYWLFGYALLVFLILLAEYAVIELVRVFRGRGKTRA